MKVLVSKNFLSQQKYNLHWCFMQNGKLEPFKTLFISNSKKHFHLWCWYYAFVKIWKNAFCKNFQHTWNSCPLCEIFDFWTHNKLSFLGLKPFLLVRSIIIAFKKKFNPPRSGALSGGGWTSRVRIVRECLNTIAS